MTVLDRYLKKYDDVLDSIPSIYYLWKESQKYVKNQDEKNIKKIERLIFHTHNSVVSPKTKLGKDVKFAYGGIGTVLHVNCIIGDYVAIGQGVTIGGSPGKARVDELGRKQSVPLVEGNVYIAAGSRLLGGIKIGKFSVIGANSVVINDVGDFSIVAGQPAKMIRKLTRKNCLRYKSFFHAFKESNNDDFINMFPDE